MYLPRFAASSTASRWRSNSPPCGSAPTDCGRSRALLDGRLKLEWRGRRTAPPRQQTLGATLDWSYGLISESERVVLRRLAIFAGPFTLQGAAAVAGEEDEPVDRIVDTLEQLVAKSLVSARPEGSSTRYRLLDTTRAYAMQKLADGGEATGIARRHARLRSACAGDRPWRRARVAATRRPVRKSVQGCSAMPARR